MEVEFPALRRIVSSNIRTLMRKRAWTQPELAKKSGVAQRTISNALNEKHGMSIETLEAIARAFDRPGWLLLLPDLSDSDLLDSNILPSLVSDFVNSGPDERVKMKNWAEAEAYLNLRREKVVSLATSNASK